MKYFMLYLFAGMILLASCSSINKIVDEGKYQAVQISDSTASEYIRNYEKKPLFRGKFKRGMFIPNVVLDSLIRQEGISGISIYYGKHPEFKSPVFIIYGSRQQLNYKRSDAFADVIYMVYYPCPTICGKG